ncbi:MAG: class I SAM-dependent methyltransferase [Myxococcales bacterium]|nr:class I SAM-dependent methyltransferase [Myxococcales bacterium]
MSLAKSSHAQELATRPQPGAAQPLHQDEVHERNLERSWYRYAATLLPENRRDQKWVDLGCGQGEFLDIGDARGLRGMGLDYNPANARANGAKRPALVADLNRYLPFGDATLDGVSLIEVIEHVIRAEELAAEIARVLRPGGWLILTTPNIAHINYRWKALFGRPPKQEGYHYRFFTRALLEKTVERAGFRICGYASYGKSGIRTRIGRLRGAGRKARVHYVVPRFLEALLARHFVWQLERGPSNSRRATDTGA